MNDLGAELGTEDAQQAHTSPKLHTAGTDQFVPRQCDCNTCLTVSPVSASTSVHNSS